MRQTAQIRDQFNEQIRSSRFLVLQEGIVLAVGAAIAKTCIGSFPIVEFMSFLTPLILGYIGIKTYGDKKGESNENPGIPLVPDR